MLPKARLKKILSYQQKKSRKSDNSFVVEGTRLTEEALKSSWNVKELFYSHSFKDSAEGQMLLDLARRKRIEVTEVQEKVVRKMAETQTPQGVVAVVEHRSFDLELFLDQKPAFTLALESLKDPGNLGTIIRTADALGVEGIFLSAQSVELYNPKVVRSSMGSLFHLPIFYPVPILELLHRLKGDIKIVASLASGGANCKQVDFSDPICLLIGGEAFGLSKEVQALADSKVSIPDYGSAESLNVSVAAGILMYEIAQSKNLRTKGKYLRNIQKEN
ncbi:MAG: hypothetical protein A2142_05060 [candidate division Zixibacteria bacterium RBG_16_48_11]|nr:MAG: hypothetical protein A2142_05060 [candidate division Zixibacteria bacterium RBG_16_48_11]